MPAQAERMVIPRHPQAIKLSAAALDGLAGEYREMNGQSVVTIFRQAETLYEKDQYGAVSELDAESAAELFYLNGSSLVRLLVERDGQGRVTALVLRDDRHEERWEKLPAASRQGAGPRP
jgi:hypothetical protein